MASIGRAPTDIERGIGIMQLTIGEVLVCRVVRVDRFGTQRGKHVHLLTRNARLRGLCHGIAIVAGAIPALWGGLLLILLLS